MAQDFAFQKGLVPLGGGAHVFLSGDEGFGLANAGLVVSDGESLVVDTLYDVRHAQEMRDEFGRHTATAPVRYVFNTHTDGDHFFGNQVFADEVEIITTEAASALMVQEHADLTAELLGGSSDPTSNMHVLAPLAKPFHFNEVRVRPRTPRSPASGRFGWANSMSNCMSSVRPTPSATQSPSSPNTGCSSPATC